MTVTYNGQGILSLERNTNWKWNRSAHSSHLTEAFNFDLKTAEFIHLEDVVTAEGLDALATSCARGIVKREEFDRLDETAAARLPEAAAEECKKAVRRPIGIGHTAFVIEKDGIRLMLVDLPQDLTPLAGGVVTPWADLEGKVKDPRVKAIAASRSGAHAS